MQFVADANVFVHAFIVAPEHGANATEKERIKRNRQNAQELVFGAALRRFQLYAPHLVWYEVEHSLLKNDVPAKAAQKVLAYMQLMVDQGNIIIAGFNLQFHSMVYSMAQQKSDT